MNKKQPKKIKTLPAILLFLNRGHTTYTQQHVSSLIVKLGEIGEEWFKDKTITRVEVTMLTEGLDSQHRHRIITVRPLKAWQRIRKLPYYIESFPLGDEDPWLTVEEMLFSTWTSRDATTWTIPWQPRTKPKDLRSTVRDIFYNLPGYESDHEEPFLIKEVR